MQCILLPQYSSVSKAQDYGVHPLRLQRVLRRPILDMMVGIGFAVLHEDHGGEGSNRAAEEKVPDGREIDDVQQFGGSEPLLPEVLAMFMVLEEHPGGYEKCSTPSVFQEVDGTMNERLRQLLIAHFMSALLDTMAARSFAFSTPHVSIGFGNPHGGLPTTTSSWPEAKGFAASGCPIDSGTENELSTRRILKRFGIVGVSVRVVCQAWKPLVAPDVRRFDVVQKCQVQAERRHTYRLTIDVNASKLVADDLLQFRQGSTSSGSSPGEIGRYA